MSLYQLELKIPLRAMPCNVNDNMSSIQTGNSITIMPWNVNDNMSSIQTGNSITIMPWNVNDNVSSIQTGNSRTILWQSHVACSTHQFRNLSEATWEKEKQNTYIYTSKF